MKLKKLTPQLILFGAITLFSINANAQSNPQDINLTIGPARTPEQRVADEVKSAELRKAAEEKRAAEEAAKIAETNPKSLLARAHVMFISSDTSFFEEDQLQNALRKREEFDRWQLAIVDGYDKRSVADIIITIDRPLFTYTFTYKIVHRNGIILATGKLTAFDGDVAAPKLAGRIMDEIRNAKGEAKPKK